MKSPLGAALAVVALSAPALAGSDVWTLSFDKPQYEPNENWTLTIDGSVGTLGAILVDVDPGPTNLPGIGLLDIGFSDAFFYLMLAIPPSGSTQIVCDLDCDSALIGIPVYVQALTFQPDLSLCPSNSAVLLVDDTTNACVPQGCTPGYWKNHPETWGPTGYSPNDDFNTVFGVDGYMEPTTLIEAASPPTELMTFAAHAVAALLNASHPNENYALEPQDVIDLVQQAVANGTLEAVKNTFEAFNEAGCPF